jgi:ArsR family transcriptional regulator
MRASASQTRIYEMHAQVCKVLSSSKRLEIINILRNGEKMVGEIASAMGLRKSNVSQQLAILRERGILVARREGQRQYYRLAYPKMLKAYDLLREVLFEQIEKQRILARRFRMEGRP